MRHKTIAACEMCGKEMRLWPSEPRRFCSRACSNARFARHGPKPRYVAPPVVRQCALCTKDFTSPRYSDRYYCSQACWSAAATGRKHAEEKGQVDLRQLSGGECLSQSQGCPFESCRHHLPGNLCALTLAAAADGGLELKEIGAVIGLTRERVRQIQVRAEQRLKRRSGISVDDLRELARIRHGFEQGIATGDEDAA